MKHIAIEGINGIGKTTQQRLLIDWAAKNGIKVLTSRLPGSPLAETTKDIRRLLDIHGPSLTPTAKLFLYLADFAEHTEKVVRGYGSQYDWLLIDRSPLSTLAYQCGMAGMSLELVELAFKAVPGAMPDFIILLDGDARQAAQRIKASEGETTKSVGGFGDMELGWYEKLRLAYKDMLGVAASHGSAVSLVNVDDKTPEEVFEPLAKFLKANYA